MAKPVTLVSRSAPGLNICGSCPGFVPQPREQRAGRATAAPLSPALTPKAIFITRRCCKRVGDWGKGEEVEEGKKNAKLFIYLVRSCKRGGALPCTVARYARPRTSSHASVQAQRGNDGRLFQTHTKPKPAKHPPTPKGSGMLLCTPVHPVRLCCQGPSWAGDLVLHHHALLRRKPESGQSLVSYC